MMQLLKLNRQDDSVALFNMLSKINICIGETKDDIISGLLDANMALAVASLKVGVTS